jgi:outer membrane protein OmpA-like peptidoglycan-associated protein
VAANADIFSLRSDTSFMLRGNVDTGADFTLASELVENAAFVADLWPDHFSVNVGVLTRVGLATLTAGGAENVSEIVVGGQLRPARDWAVDLGFGRGLTEGYGTTRFRVMAGVTWSHTPRPPKPTAVVAVVPPPVEDIPDQVIIDEIAKPPPKPPEWSATELARLEQDQIVIRDPIQFEFAKDVILPVSLPTLKYVGSIMTDHPEIVHVVIEGHASDEGSYYYNYDLAKKRADAIWRALIEAGVSPTRLSTRSMGEVEPKNQGEDETSLAENRRVEFHIVKRLAPGEKPPEYKLDIKQPWTGEPEKLPPPPAVPPPLGPDGKPLPVGPDGKPLPPAPPDGVDSHTFDDDDDGGTP